MTLLKITDVNNKMEVLFLFILTNGCIFNLAFLATPARVHDTLWAVVFRILFLIPTVLALILTLIDFTSGWAHVVRRVRRSSTLMSSEGSQVI